MSSSEIDLSRYKITKFMDKGKFVKPNEDENGVPQHLNNLIYDYLENTPCGFEKFPENGIYKHGFCRGVEVLYRVLTQNRELEVPINNYIQGLRGGVDE